MVQAYAVNTVHVCRKAGEKKDGKTTRDAQIEIVPAGQVFEVEQEVFDDLLKSGAVRVPTKRDRVLAAEGDETLDSMEVQTGQHQTGAPVAPVAPVVVAPKPPPKA